MLWVAVAALVGSFLLSAAATLVVRAAARRRGFVDRPGGHKGHDAPIALGGGIAITVAACLPVIVVTVAALIMRAGNVPAWLPDALAVHVGGIAYKANVAFAVIGGAVILHVVGLIDDIKALGPAAKFTAQVLVAIALAAGFRVRLMEMWPAPVSVALTTVWIVLITNAFNFLDNMDGLSAGVAVIAGTIFAIAAFAGGQLFVPVMTLLLVGSLAGFLLFNFPPATIFMGDAGSMVIGYLLAVMTILTTFYNPDQQLRPAGVLLPLVVLAVPLYDVASVIVHRRRAGVSVFRGDRRHFSHRLCARGLSQRDAVLTIYLATAATSLSGILLPHLAWYPASLVFAQCLCVVLIIAVLEHS